MSLGTNIGDRLKNLKTAIQKIDLSPKSRVVRTSSVYETEPVGFIGQPDFLNLVVEIRTGLCPLCLWLNLQRIEAESGRIRKIRWGPRKIDIDIIYFGEITRKNSIITIPHRAAAARGFVLIPLNEIAPDFMPPQTCYSISQLLNRCEDHSRVIKISNTGI